MSGVKIKKLKNLLGDHDHLYCHSRENMPEIGIDWSLSTTTTENDSVVVVSKYGLRELTLKESAIEEIKEQPFF